MEAIASPLEPTVIRQVFALWSIRIPASFEETFVHGDDYWHAWDADRSVSLTSIVVTDRGRPVGPGELLRTFPPLTGDPVATPPGLVGWAVAAPAVQPARASRAISGVIATDGRLLLVTITGDDPNWTTATWLSIRYGAASGRSGARAHS
jgi:hypothetical protein